MKVLSSIVVLMVVGAALAEPVRRPSFQRQTAAAAPAKPEPESEPAPYPASGWKPAGPQLQYGPPNPAEPKTTETPETTTTPSESTPAPARLQQQPEPVSGVYYILLEDGRLQQVEFTDEPAQAQLPARLEVQPAVAPAAIQPRTARIRLQLQDVEPIRGPVYAYSGPLQRILRQA